MRLEAFLPALLTVSALAHSASAQASGAPPAEARPKLTIRGAAQVASDTIIAFLPNICFDTGGSATSAVEEWLEGFRVIAVPGAETRTLEPAVVHVEAKIVLVDECFDEAWLKANHELGPKVEYRVLVGALDVARNVEIVPGSATLPPRALTLSFDRRDPFRIEVVTPVCLPADELADGIEVGTTEAGGTESNLEILEAQQSGEAPGPCLLVLLVAEPVRHETKIKVTARRSSLGPLVGSQAVEFPVPKNKEDSEFYLQVAAEAGEDQKPNVLIDLKFDREDAVELGEHWTLGIDLGLEVATRDAEETNKLNVAYPFSRKWIFPTDDGVAGVYAHFAPRIEAEDVFANRNVMLDVSASLVLSTLHGAIGEYAPRGGKDLRWKYEWLPTLGYQWGENQHLEDEDLLAFEGYSVSRGVAELHVSLIRERPTESPVKSISFSVDYSGWYRFSQELDTFTDAEGESAVRLKDGFVDFLTAALDLRLSEAFGLVLEYETGERPVLFEDEDKASIALSYRF